METNIMVNEDLAAIHAYLCSDGYVSGPGPGAKHKHYHIGLRNTSLVLLEDFQQKFSHVFKKEPIISKCKDRCKIGDKEIFCWLTENFGSFHSDKWTLPDCFMAKELLAPWLRAFFGCEGWVEVAARKSRTIGAVSINAVELEKISRCLKEKFSITSGFHLRKGRNIASLTICGRDDLLKFKDAIGFLHPSKKKKLEEAMASFIDYNWRFPEDKPALKRFVLKILRKKINCMRSRIRICSNKRENLLRLADALALLFSIDSKVSSERFNGVGTGYFELTIQKKESLLKLKSALYSVIG
jgi:hypothetical protein